MSKKKLLLHVCCAPCLVGMVDELLSEYDLTVYFYNPNIHPQAEYKHRLQEVKRFCQLKNIKLIIGEYNIKKWFSLVVNYKHEPEGGQRCQICFKMRLEQTAKYAQANGFQYFASTLTSGRNKKAELINNFGKILAEKYNLKFLTEDWKKKGRQEKGIKICKELNIYRQNYCGCVYSQINR